MVNERVAVALEDVAVGYRRGGDLTTVVRGIDATLECGRLVALLGRNGAGKSTLLRTLAAFQQPLAGKVCYGYNEQGHLSQQELAKKVAVVLTGGGFAALTVRELVSLGRTPYTNFMGRLTRTDKEIVEEAMLQMGVMHLAQRPVETLSDGERQKCLIAKAIA
ncbi:MAG: ABC transporter ATP-binding protein, partial [Bacteroidaceae bacterium]|nr:ABC transporter ATP-binding protein [Bacteroidaceae bacterium]